MTEKAPCGACDACEHCPFPDCIYTGLERTPFDIEQDRIRQEKARIKRELAEKKAASDKAFAEWMKKNRISGRGRRACRVKR